MFVVAEKGTPLHLTLTFFLCFHGESCVFWYSHSGLEHEVKGYVPLYLWPRSDASHFWRQMAKSYIEEQKKWQRIAGSVASWATLELYQLCFAALHGSLPPCHHQDPPPTWLCNCMVYIVPISVVQFSTRRSEMSLEMSLEMSSEMSLEKTVVRRLFCSHKWSIRSDCKMKDVRTNKSQFSKGPTLATNTFPGSIQDSSYHPGQRVFENMSGRNSTYFHVLQ